MGLIHYSTATVQMIYSNLASGMPTHFESVGNSLAKVSCAHLRLAITLIWEKYIGILPNKYDKCTACRGDVV